MQTMEEYVRDAPAMKDKVRKLFIDRDVWISSKTSSFRYQNLHYQEDNEFSSELVSNKLTSIGCVLCYLGC